MQSSLLQLFREKWHRLKVLQRTGRHMGKVDVDDMDQHVCLNCKTAFKGNFCPACGQSARTRRLNFASAADTLLGIYYNFERGIMHTIIDMLYRPGYMVRDYFRGHRSEYIKPIQLLFLFTTIILLFNLLPQDNDVLGSILDSLKTKLDGSYVLAILYKLHDAMSNAAVRVLLSTTLSVLPMWLVFRPTYVGRQTNIAETFYLMVYITCVELLFEVLFTPVRLLVGLTAEGDVINSILRILLVHGLFIWMVHQYYQLGWWKSIWKTILFTAFQLSIIITLSIIIIVIIVLCNGDPADFAQ